MRSKLLTLGRRHAEEAQQRAQQRAAGERARAAEWDRLVDVNAILSLLVTAYEVIDNAVHSPEPGVSYVPVVRLESLHEVLLRFDLPAAVAAAGKRKGP